MKKKAAPFAMGILVIMALVLLAVPVYAGGWATVGIVEMPDEIQAGSPFTIEFMVWQHGNKPVHKLYWDNNERLPVTPRISFGSAEAGKILTFDAQPLAKPGLFGAEVTLPTEGEWEWSISPDPMRGVSEFQPLFVQPPAAEPQTTNASVGFPFCRQALYPWPQRSVSGKMEIINLTNFWIQFTDHCLPTSGK